VLHDAAVEVHRRGVVVIGYGLAGRVFHAPLVDAAPDLEVAAIVTRHPARVAQARADFPHAEILADAPAALYGSERFDLAVVATPNEHHVPIALACIEAKIPVVVDKPLAPSWQDASELVERAEEAGVLLSVFQNRRYDGDFLTLRDVIGQGLLGRVDRFESRFERWRPVVEPARWREDPDPARAGGVLFDLGSHLIDQALLLFGAPRQVYAELDTRRRGGAVDDDVFVAITHASGVRSHLFASALAAQLGPRFRVLGNLAGYTKYGLDVQEGQLAAGLRPGDEGWGVGAADDDGVLGAGQEGRTVVTRAGSYEAFYAEMAGALVGQCPVPVDPRDAVTTLRVIGAAREAASTRRVVEFDERPMSP
jgi:predicted dehydrogenase